MYVGNLSFDVTQGQLEQMFTPYGAVRSAQLITDRDTGRSKGFGFVEMSSDREAEAAISGMSGQMVGGRALTVNEAKPREPRSGGFGGGRRYWPPGRSRPECEAPARGCVSGLSCYMQAFDAVGSTAEFSARRPEENDVTKRTPTHAIWATRAELAAVRSVTNAAATSTTTGTMSARHNR